MGKWASFLVYQRIIDVLRLTRPFVNEGKVKKEKCVVKTNLFYEKVRERDELFAESIGVCNR